MRKVFLLLALFACSLPVASFAQADSLLDMLNGSDKDAAKEPVTATFKATRIINSSTVENLAAGTLDFRISHRFGQIDQGVDNFFGLDNATTRIGLDYGVTQWLMLGIGHSTLYKDNDGFLKLRLLRQKKAGTPVSISYFGGVAIQGAPKPTIPAGTEWYFTNKLNYTNQILIARKFSDRISLQLMPTLVHYNLVDSSKFDNNTFALGVGGRIKVSRRVAITGEYYYRFTNSDMLSLGSKTYNSLSLGVDVETGGHVFQMFFSNSAGMTERTFIGQTTNTWGEGELHFGFNISRVFTVVKPKEFRGGGSAKW